MPVRYYIDDNLDLLVGEGTGAITDGEVIEALDKIIKETHGAAFFKASLFVADKQASSHDLTIDALMRIKGCVEEWGKVYPGRNVKTAILVSDTVRGAVAVIWQALTEIYPSIGAHVQLFYGKPEALAWLKSEEP